MGEQSLEPSLPQDSAFVITYVDSCIGDIRERSKGYSLFTSSAQAMEAQRDCGVSILPPAWETLHSTGSSALAEDGSCSKTEESKETQTLYSSSNALSAKRKQGVKRPLPHMTLDKKMARQISTNRNSTVSYTCKACGKIFHYMYTLRAHVQTHMKDESCVCGICGKHLQSTESLVQHLQSHTKSNKCGTCGKQFSSHSRLKRHRMFHRPKAVNVISSA